MDIVSDTIWPSDSDLSSASSLLFLTDLYSQLFLHSFTLYHLRIFILSKLVRCLTSKAIFFLFQITPLCGWRRPQLRKTPTVQYLGPTPRMGDVRHLHWGYLRSYIRASSHIYITNKISGNCETGALERIINYFLLQAIGRPWLLTCVAFPLYFVVN